MAKVHLAAGPFGLAECGKQNVDTSRMRVAVNCASCRRTLNFRFRPRHKKKTGSKAT